MIKVIYIASIPVLFILIVIFSILHFTYRPPIINQEMTRISENMIKDNPPDISEGSSYEAKPQIPSEIWKNNIFDSTRALFSEGSKGSASLKDVMLLGIFENGGISGAVFLMANLSSGGGQAYGMSQGGSYGGGQSSYGGSVQQIPPKPKMVFLVGERLPNGFMIKSITRDSVLLQGGEDLVTLNMEFADENSKKRLAESQRSNVQQQVKIIESGKQSSGGSSGGASSSDVIIRNAPDSKQGPY